MKNKLAWAYALALVKLLTHALTLKPYGFFRDELYYIACSNHMDWGYVDQPPFSIAVLKLWRSGSATPSRRSGCFRPSSARRRCSSRGSWSSS